MAVVRLAQTRRARIDLRQAASALRDDVVIAGRTAWRARRPIGHGDARVSRNDGRRVRVSRRKDAGAATSTAPPRSDPKALSGSASAQKCQFTPARTISLVSGTLVRMFVVGVGDGLK